MVLFVREGCTFCDRFAGIPGLVVARMVMTPRGMRARIDGQLVDAPPQLRAYPSLLDGEKVYVGKAAIEERLRRK